MAGSKRQITTLLSAVYLVLLIVLAAYALYKIRNHALPLPTSLGAFTIALPAIAGLGLEYVTSFSGTGSLQVTPTQPQLIHPRSMMVLFLFVVETVLATLSGTYIAPQNNLDCHLQDRWRNMFQHKDSRIRVIQDGLNCCGLRSTKDMAFPFPANGKGPELCEQTYGRSQSCFKPWRTEEQRFAAILLVVDVLVVLWQVAILYGRAPKMPTWLGRILHGRRAEGHSEHQGSRAIDYQRVEGRYLDDPGEDEDAAEEDIPRGRTLGNNLSGEDDYSSRVQPSQLHDSQNLWSGR